MAICTRYDPNADAAWIYFRRPSDDLGPARAQELDEVRIIAYDSEDRVLAVELLDVSRGVNLDGLPGRFEIQSEWQRLARAYGWRT